MERLACRSQDNFPVNKDKKNVHVAKKQLPRGCRSSENQENGPHPNINKENMARNKQKFVKNVRDKRLDS